MLWSRTKLEMPSADTALPGREVALEVVEQHYVSGHSIFPPYPNDLPSVVFGLGCFWGAERRFWQTPGVYVTAAGYAGGFTPNPLYEEVCSGQTGHTEVVLVVFDPAQRAFNDLLQLFWEAHDPTQGMRQGNDIGTQYRSAIYTTNDEQYHLALASRDAYQRPLTKAGFGAITTEIKPLTQFYYAETYHQQYLGKHPDGYCGLRGTGVSCPVGLLHA